MKKRVKKSSAKSESLLDAAISRETDEKADAKVKRVTRKASSKKALSDKKNLDAPTDKASELENGSDDCALISRPKRGKPVKKASDNPNAIPADSEKSSGRSSKKKRPKSEANVKRKASSSKKVLDVKGFEVSDSFPDERNSKRTQKKAVKHTTIGKKASASKKRTIRKKESPTLFDIESDATFDINNDNLSTTSDLTSQIVDELETIKSKMELIEVSDAEKKRRNRNQAEKSIAQKEDFGYVGELPFWKPGWLVVQGAREHNLKSIDVPFPLSAFTVVTGVSGSGKSSLVEDVLHRYLARTLNRSQLPCGACDAVVGLERINKVVKVDQAPIGQTPTSNAATFTGVFDLIRQLFAQLPEAKLRRYSPRHFSFNVPGGRCEKCEGSGMLKVEMHFLADVFITCDACGGKRYDSDTLQVKYHGKSISDVLETTCGEALKFFASIPPIARILQTLCDVGLDYLPLGQPATTLSGGESQRIKLAAELSQRDSGRIFYILDEPTTGLHFEDVRKLLNVLHRLVDLGNTVVVVEHNLDVVKNADWVIEIGPEAGLEGGRLVFAGTPEQLIEYAVRWHTSSKEQKSLLRTYTGEALIPVFSRGVFEERPIQSSRTVQRQDVDVDKAVELIEDSSQDISDQPWEIDGKRWHTEFRTTRSGVPCKWEGRVLNAIVEKLEEKTLFAETDWQNKTSVEIRLEDKPNVWFLRAITNEEWLLRLKFRTAKNTFDKGALARKLALKPLKDVEEIPLYGTLPRVKVDVVGAWQEIEIKVFSFSEIDRQEFWDFLELAYERFAKLVERPKDLDVDLTPWKTQGRSWHTSTSGFYGAGKPRWPIDLLEKTIDVVEGIDKNMEFIWINKIAVPFLIKGKSVPLGKIYTKNSDFLSIQINYPSGEITLNQVAGIGYQPELEHNELGFDSLYLRFRTLDELDVKTLRTLLKQAYAKYKRLKNEE